VFSVCAFLVEIGSLFGLGPIKVFPFPIVWIFATMCPILYPFFWKRPITKNARLF